MIRACHCALRYRTPWRDILHPLPLKARRQQYFRRDLCEVNEAVLRRPYYHIVSETAKEISEREALRETLEFPGAIGPLPADSKIPRATHGLLRPRYPQAFNLVPPHQPSKR